MSWKEKAKHVLLNSNVNNKSSTGSSAQACCRCVVGKWISNNIMYVKPLTYAIKVKYKRWSDTDVKVI